MGKMKSAFELRDDGLIYFNGLVSWANIYHHYGLIDDQKKVLKILQNNEKSHFSSW